MTHLVQWGSLLPSLLLCQPLSWSPSGAVETRLDQALHTAGRLPTQNLCPGGMTFP